MKVSVELEDLVRLAGMQHAEPAPMPAPMAEPMPADGGCGGEPPTGTEDMRDMLTVLASPKEAVKVKEHDSDDFENASPEFSGTPNDAHGDIDDMSFRGFGKTRGDSESDNKYGDNPLNEEELMTEWKKFKKKD